ncbi:MAG TPA: 7-cyano-7-deazaguanine synthase [Niallia sp.]|nr:7-cyano-7-deazaguanine synthase [Niallia sp.]
MKRSMESLASLHKEFLQDMYFDYEDNSTKYIDLITIMACLFFCESEKKKGKTEIIIPVFHLSIWEKEKDAVEELFKWVLNKSVPLQFTKIEPTHDQELRLALPTNQNVSLFLDDIESLTGLYYSSISRESYISDYIRIIDKDNEKSKQQKLTLFLRNSVSDSTEIKTAGSIFNKKRIHHSPASLLLLLMIAATRSYFNGGSAVYYYQSMKINLDCIDNFKLLDTVSHPKTFELLNALFGSISANMMIKTPLLYKTRAEILKELPNKYKLQMKNTNECLRMKRKIEDKQVDTPCGICTACIQRKIHMAASNNEVYDGFYQYDYGQKLVEMKNDQDKQIFTDSIQLMQTIYDYVESNLENVTLEEQHAAKEFMATFSRFIEKYNPN